MSWCLRPRWASRTIWIRSRSLRSVAWWKACSRRWASSSVSWMRITFVGGWRRLGRLLVLRTGQHQRACESEARQRLGRVAERLEVDVGLVEQGQEEAAHLAVRVVAVVE